MLGTAYANIKCYFLSRTVSITSAYSQIKWYDVFNLNILHNGEILTVGLQLFFPQNCSNRWNNDEC